MSEDANRASAKAPSLSLDQLAELQRGTGEIMHEIGDIWWKCAYAGRGGNWALAAYFARRTRTLLRKLSIVRPKYADDIADFEGRLITAVLRACERSERDAFERAHAEAVDRANELHVKWAYGYIRWKLPSDPPKDLDLTAGPPTR